MNLRLTYLRPAEAWTITPPEDREGDILRATQILNNIAALQLSPEEIVSWINILAFTTLTDNLRRQRVISNPVDLGGLSINRDLRHTAVEGFAFAEIGQGKKLLIPIFNLFGPIQYEYGQATRYFTAVPSAKPTEPLGSIMPLRLDSGYLYTWPNQLYNIGLAMGNLDTNLNYRYPSEYHLTNASLSFITPDVIVNTPTFDIHQLGEEDNAKKITNGDYYYFNPYVQN